MEFGVPTEETTEKGNHAIVKYKLLALIGGQGTLHTYNSLAGDSVYSAWLTDIKVAG